MARARAATVVLALLLLAACSGGGPAIEGPGAAQGGDATAPEGGGGGESEAGGGGEGGEGGSIRFLHWRGEDSAVFDELIAAFTEETGITVETNVIPSAQYEEQAQAAITGTGGADVFATFPGNQFAALAPTGVYADLSDAEFTGRFEERFLEAGNFEGAQLALPFQLVFNIPVYNVGLFEELGLEPPADWDGFLQLCEDLKAAEVTPILFAGDISPSQFINPMMMNNMPDEDIFQRVEAGEARVDEEWMVTTLSQIAQLQSNGCFQEDPLGTRNETLAATFAQGEAGMLATGSYAMAQIDAINPDLEMGLLAPITVPEADAVWEGIRTTTFMLGVNAESQNAEAAQSFIEFLTRPENASTYANGTGQLLTLTDVTYETEELQAQTEWIDRETRFQPRFTITEGEINTGLITAVEDVLSGVPPEQAAATFQATVDRVIAAG